MYNAKKLRVEEVLSVPLSDQRRDKEGRLLEKRHLQLMSKPLVVYVSVLPPQLTAQGVQCSFRAMVDLVGLNWTWWENSLWGLARLMDWYCAIALALLVYLYRR